MPNLKELVQEAHVKNQANNALSLLKGQSDTALTIIKNCQRRLPFDLFSIYVLLQILHHKGVHGKPSFLSSFPLLPFLPFLLFLLPLLLFPSPSCPLLFVNIITLERFANALETVNCMNGYEGGRQNYYFQRGKSHHQMNQKKEAIQNYEACLAVKYVGNHWNARQGLIQVTNGIFSLSIILLFSTSSLHSLPIDI